MTMCLKMRMTICLRWAWIVVKMYERSPRGISWEAGGDLVTIRLPALCPGARRCRTTLIGYACGVPRGPAAHDGPSASLPCTCRHGAGKRQGKVERQVGTTCIRKFSCCQDVILLLWEKQDLDR